MEELPEEFEDEKVSTALEAFVDVDLVRQVPDSLLFSLFTVINDLGQR